MDLRLTTYSEMRSKGPIPASILFCGEAPGAEEEMLGIPFVGTSGKELDKLCLEAGLDPASCYFTNVFRKRPVDNKIENFCVKNRELGISGMPALQPGQYVMREFASELERFYSEIEEVKPNVICPLGNAACWAVFRQTPKITALRGRIREASIRGFKYKVLPTFHPAYLFRSWKDRVVVAQDLRKLKREARWPDVRIPVRHVLVDPTFAEADEFLERALHSNEITLDVETLSGQISVFGVGLRPDLAAAIPFIDTRTLNWCYWTEANELKLVRKIRRLCAKRSVVKICQNGLYDITYLWENWRCPIVSFDEDTMLQAHALWPELKKDLGTLATFHTDEPAWKTMRLRNRDDYKREE